MSGAPPSGVRVRAKSAASGVPARSTVFGFIHYAMREFFTLSVSLVRGYI